MCDGGGGGGGGGEKMEKHIFRDFNQGSRYWWFLDYQWVDKTRTLIFGLSPAIQKTQNQRGPVGTGQKSSDDEVSYFELSVTKKYSLKSKEMSEYLYPSPKKPYIVCVERLSVW